MKCHWIENWLQREYTVLQNKTIETGGKLIISLLQKELEVRKRNAVGVCYKLHVNSVSDAPK